MEWMGQRDSFGYGRIKVGGKKLYTHRLAYELKHGPIPKGAQVLHRCDNPPCCNDEHLFLGTNKDNSDDKVAKGRSAKRAGHGMAKLSEEKVLEIRMRLSLGESHRSIARSIGISQTTVCNINRGKTWAK